MKHINQKNDWLNYEFKPYFFILVGMISLVLKSNVTLSTGHNVVAYFLIGTLFVAAARILMWRSDYRTRASRN